MHEHINVRIRWIKAHVNHEGNEIADEEVKIGTTRINIQTVPQSKAEINNLIDTHIREVWNKEYSEAKARRKDGTTKESYLQTKIFFPVTDKYKSKEIMNLNRYELGLIVRYITGFAHLRKQNYRIGEAIDFTCRYCGHEEESPSHLITSCPALWKQRLDHLGNFILDKDNPTWTVKGLTSFIKSINLECKSDLDNE